MVFAAELESYTGPDLLIATVTDLKNLRIHSGVYKMGQYILRQPLSNWRDT